MITSLRVAGYKSIRDATFELGPLTVLVGRNGAGKSNLVDALVFLRDALTSGLRSAVDRRNVHLAHYGSRQDAERGIELELRGDNEARRWAYGLRTQLYPAPPEARFIAEEFFEAGAREREQEREVRFQRRRNEWVVPPPQVAPALADMSLVMPLLADLPLYSTAVRDVGDAARYEIGPAPLRHEYHGARSGRLADDLANAAAVVSYVDEHFPEAGKEICDDLSGLAPGYVGVDAYQDGFGYYGLHLARRTRSGLHGMFASEESDGILCLLGMLIALHQQPLPRMLIIEEPELNLHPSAMPRLCDLFEGASETCQVVLTTQSPDLIAHLPVESLRVVEWEDGETKVGPLARDQEETVRDRLFSSGDLVRIDGALRREGADG